MGLRAGYTKRKNGTLQLGFTYEQKRYFVYGHTYQECEYKKQERIDQIKNHLLKCNDRITMSEYYDEWQKTRIHQIEDSTKYTNDRRWERMKSIIGNERVARLETHQIVGLRNKLLEELAITTVNDEMTLLNQIMESAIEDKIRLDNPCKSKKLKPIEPDEEASDTYHRALTLEEQALFFKAAKERTFYYEALVFMISTGIRVGELGALKWGDIDYKKNVVKITKTVTRISNSEYIIKNKPKTKKSIREIPLSKTAKDALMSQRRKTEILAIDGNIFPTSEGGLLHKGIINAAISNVLEKIELSQKIKIEHFTSHALRATFATRAIEQGMTPQTLKTIMGHSSYKMTMDLYAHVLPNTKQEEMKKIEFVV